MSHDKPRPRIVQQMHDAIARVTLMNGERIADHMDDRDIAAITHAVINKMEDHFLS